MPKNSQDERKLVKRFESQHQQRMDKRRKKYEEWQSLAIRLKAVRDELNAGPERTDG